MLDKAAERSGVSGLIRLKNMDIPTETREIEQKKLQFYVDNPRIYSLVRSDGRTPDQEEICKQLQGLEHVKELIQDIAANGGLIDPLLVRDGDFVVLEGNSRLAAYRHLAGKDPIKWGKVRCTVLPGNIDEKLVFALLGQYHIKGKKDWAPYEKAGFLYRRHVEHNIPLPTVALDLGVPRGEAEHLIAVYKFMMQHDDDRDHWSYYDEFLKSNRINKVRKDYAGFDKFVVEQVKTKQIPKAMELRDRLPTICAGPQKILKRYVDGKIAFADAYESAVDAGSENYALKRLKKFREWVAQNDTEEDLLESNKTVRDKMSYELKEIEKRSKKLKELLEKKRNQFTN
ncbi:MULTISPECIES: ParB N-terminal domain-containing protein [unclassified Bradyrhizobium]|uniref:ParB N-terminal domain-containing protein n=1 Tax=unclassified Bradyrhizobium TaxID=2631580 RepID=UPI0029163083|nr:MULTISPECIES: ParB N-terminal domain-containing protein [unclassified Bradyrhizobium]